MTSFAISPRRFPMRAPDDLECFEKSIDSGQIDPAGIVSLWCKTRGNGLRNDFTKPWTDLLLRTSLARRLGATEQTISENIPILVSGGSEGVVSPHLVVWSKGTSGSRGLIGCTGRRIMAAGDLGTDRQRIATSDQLAELMADAGLKASDVGLVLVRAPAHGDVSGNDAAVREVVALGVARTIDGPEAEYASRAFVVARHDGLAQQMFVLANGPGGDPDFAVGHAVLADPLDAGSVATMLRALGAAPAPQLNAEDRQRVVAVISKGDAPSDGLVRGLPHAMNVDNDIAMHRHARAAYGGLLSTLIGHSAVLVSGGAERQGPPNGGFASAVVSISKGGRQ